MTGSGNLVRDYKARGPVLLARLILAGLIDKARPLPARQPPQLRRLLHIQPSILPACIAGSTHARTHMHSTPRTYTRLHQPLTQAREVLGMSPLWIQIYGKGLAILCMTPEV